jgi:hypothetical protein
MKSILNISIVSLSVLSLSLGTVGCSDSYMDKINQNNDNLPTAPAKFILADVLTSTAFHDIGGDMDTYISTYNEYEVGIYGQLWDAQNRNSTSSSTTFGDSWNDVYNDLMDSRLVIAKSAAAGSLHTEGMGEVMAAITSAIITDNFGDVPYSQAALTYLVNGLPPYTNPKLDTQESVYDSVMVHLNNAIADLSAKSTDSPGAYDYLYNGDATKWLKLAYGLRARYTMRLYDTYSASDKVAKMKDVISDVAQSFQSVSDQAAYNVYTSSNRNPYYDFFDSRNYFAISPTYLSKLAARNDPRLNNIVVDQADGNIQLADTNYTQGGGLASINGGSSQKQYTYNVSIYSFACTAPTFYMSYHELMFLAAEAYERLGDLPDSKAALRKAVVAAIVNTQSSITNVDNSVDELNANNDGSVTMTADTAGLGAVQAGAYFDNNVSKLFDANPLQEIAIQKYLGLFGCNGEATEAYADIRRHKAANEDYYNFGNTLNSTEYPWELPYGSSAVTANKYVLAAYGNGQYVYQNCLWWAGGTGKAGK